MFHNTWIIMMNDESVAEGLTSKSIHEAQCHPQQQGQPFLLAQSSLYILVKVDLSSFWRRSERIGMIVG